MNRMEYSGFDYPCPECGRKIPLMVVDDALKGGKRMLFVAEHPRDDGPSISPGPNCPTSDRFIRFAEVIPDRRREENGYQEIFGGPIG